MASYGSNKSETVNTLDAKYETAYIGLQLVLPIYSGGQVSAQVTQSERQLPQDRGRVRRTPYRDPR
ncbi:hypothetical protein ACU4GD_14845 [Cupriavidus basilensis]